VLDGLLVRPATDDDEAFVRAAHHVAFRDVVERQFGPWDEARQDVFFDTVWRHGGMQVVECDGHRCGYLLVDEHADEVVVGEIVLHPDVHGRGIGTRLLRDVFAVGKPVRLQVLHENRRARALYERLGFTQTGSTSTHHLMWRAADAPAGSSTPRPSR
jgi:ribosomal protein S18 acetylase RimI-like enzyme